MSKSFLDRKKNCFRLGETVPTKRDEKGQNKIFQFFSPHNRTCGARAVPCGITV
jgi:hypothetical protein